MVDIESEYRVIRARMGHLATHSEGEKRNLISRFDNLYDRGDLTLDDLRVIDERILLLEGRNRGCKDPQVASLFQQEYIEKLNFVSGNLHRKYIPSEGE